MAVATFDFANLRIILPPGDVTIEVERDLYSAWKRATLVDDNIKHLPAFRTSVGGDTLTPGIESGAYFFLQNQNGWRVRPAEADATVTLTGNLIAEEPSLPLTTPTLGGFTVLINGIQPITQNVNELLLVQQESEYNGVVSLDTFSGVAGTEYPIGTRSTPVSNIADALTILTTRGFSQLELTGSVVLPSTFSFKRILGTSGVATVDVNGQDVSGTVFERVGVLGDFSGVTPSTPPSLLQCSVTGPVTDFIGRMDSTLIASSISLVAGQTNLLRCLSNLPGLARPAIDFQGNAVDLGVRGYIGGLEIQNMTNALSDVSVDVDGARIELDSTVTAGTFVLGGVGTFINNSSLPPASISKDGFVDGLDVKLIKALDAGNITITGSNPFVITVIDPDDGVTVLGTWEVTPDGRTRTRTS